MSKIVWPDNKKFAFTVFDDTDFATLENVVPVYSFLKEHGFQTTKSVWPMRGLREPKIGGATCDDENYLQWLLELQRDGFEIGFHNATNHSSEREFTIRGLEKFKELFGHYPKSMANHADCEESIYWGNYRLSGIIELVYNILLRNKHKGLFRGHIEGDRFFWGDHCKEKVAYVRNFVYDDINTFRKCPYMPYYDPVRPYVNNWFASSEGAKVAKFNNCISERNQDRLEEEGGACIMYTHFACGFVENDRVHPRFKELMDRLGRKKGWFVPVSTMMDYIRGEKGDHVISSMERYKLELKWMIHKIMIGGST